MKTKLRFALCTLLLALAAGCVNHGWQGLIPNKDARFRGVKATLATPWGSQTLLIDEIDTRMDPQGTNPLALLPQPPAPVDVKQ